MNVKAIVRRDDLWRSSADSSACTTAQSRGTASDEACVNVKCVCVCVCATEGVQSVYFASIHVLYACVCVCVCVN